MSDDQPNMPGRIGLGLLLRRTHRGFAGAMAGRLAELGLTHAEFHHLRRLNERDGVSSSELSDLVEVKKASSTAILDALERKGLIRRERDAADRRRVNVFLTGDGRAIQPALKACAETVNEVSALYMTPAERAQLFDLLERVNKGLAEAPRHGSDAAE